MSAMAEHRWHLTLIGFFYSYPSFYAEMTHSSPPSLCKSVSQWSKEKVRLQRLNAEATATVRHSGQYKTVFFGTIHYMYGTMDCIGYMSWPCHIKFITFILVYNTTENDRLIVLAKKQSVCKTQTVRTCVWPCKTGSAQYQQKEEIRKKS